MFDRRGLDRVFGALAHADRRRVLDLLKAEPGSTVGEVAAAFRTSRVAIMKHLAVLEDAGLVVSRREGRCRRLHLNPAPIRMIHDRWTTRFSALWARGLAEDRKSTRLNSSHSQISYAVFCLKKKTNN